MKKIRELTDPTSCLSKARDDEYLFVLLARDAAAPATIRFWVAERLRLGKNTAEDAQIQQALGAAQAMEDERNPWPGSAPSERLVPAGDEEPR